jgi:DNA-binding response OmpR family regulator
VREKSKIPIIMLSAKDGEGDKMRCLEIGADDYLTKPFSLTELLTRVKVVLRRSHVQNSPSLASLCSIGNLEIDSNNHMVYLKGHELDLTATEYKILTFLSMNAGRIISQQLILEKVWGDDYIGKPRVLWVNLSRLRRKLKERDADREYICTRPGLGYMIKEKVPTTENKM